MRNKQNNFSGIIALTFLLLMLCYNGVAQKDVNRISKEQKLYELSIVWKELSYNFANMDNCPNLDLDSLYREYIPLIQNTKDDWEYCKMTQKFLAHFNNGHTDIYNIPTHLYQYVARPFIKTAYKDNKIIIDNLGEFHTKGLQIGDEIVTINGVNALDFFNEFYVPYICTSNEKNKIHNAMFNTGPAHLLKKNTKITLGIKTDKGIKKVNIFADQGLTNKDNSKNENWLVNNLSVSNEYLFAIDTINDFAYIRLTICNKYFEDFFTEKYPLISKVGNLIVDISHNRGGNITFTNSAVNTLVNQDTIYRYTITGKIHNAYAKGYAAMTMLNPSNSNIENYFEQLSLNYYKGNVFESIRSLIDIDDSYYENPAYERNRYKGKIYVITGNNTVSAGEGFAIELSQGENIMFLGSKTAGAIGNIYPTRLPSGLVFIMNVSKTYDYKNRDISSGFIPDYEYDFSDFYKTNNPNEILSKFIGVINGLEKR